MRRGWKFFSSLLRPDTGSGAPPGVKASGREADHSPPSSAEVNIARSYTFTTRIRLHGVVLS
jgi:hypothetical protein